MSLFNTLFTSIVLPLVLSSVDEYRLLQHLKENYNYFERPVENNSLPLDVKVRFLLNQILDVDEKNQVMSILAYIDFHWNDYKLRWDPRSYGGIRDVRFSGDQDAPFKLWRPDVLLFNSVSESFDSTYSSRFIVNYDGEVQQNPPGIFRFICRVDVTYYPFDTQTCFLKFGSWTYNGKQINLDFLLTKIVGKIVDVTYYPFDTQTCFLKFGSWTDNGKQINLDFLLTKIVGVKGYPIQATTHPYGENPDSYSVNESIDLQVYLQNGEWDLMILGVKGYPIQATTHPYGENPDSYSVNESIDLQVYLQNGEWDLMNTPGTRVVTVFGDASYHELYYYIRIRRRTLAYGINLIIPSLVISMMTVLGFTLPPDACEKVTLETTVLLSVIFFLQMVSNMSPPQSKSVPILGKSTLFVLFWMRRVFVEWLPYILMMRTPDHPRAPKPKVIDKTILPVHRLSTFPVMNLPRTSTLRSAISKAPNTDSGKRAPCLKYMLKFCDELKEINIDLEKMTSVIKDMYTHEMVRSEWRFAAMAVDRLCLYLFSVFITISTCGIIMPHILIKNPDACELLFEGDACVFLKVRSEWRFAAMAVDRLCLYLFSVFITISTCGIIMPHILMGLKEQP
ncbi:Neurotransmitter-gated ion-channel ligand binding domain protein [Dictyocaulus viviparus]|uniref:Neurotransmitter-gated ion-channel ligand binding domain protein n=1 Tax=Dictyocaulus viviparus TaxID=29172 RepID=A0A0D8XEE4_DICVI|nr:Neurotransmitter-gated ion-channel ligand binding domain protein [Dictyocaulus viviparus]